MNDDLIRRQAAITEFSRCELTPDGGIDANYAIDFLKQMPPVDAVPVVRGEWIEENTRPRSGVFYCSSCHRTCYDIQPTRLKGWTKRCRYAFCPNCGADMRKDGEHG